MVMAPPGSPSSRPASAPRRGNASGSDASSRQAHPFLRASVFLLFVGLAAAGAFTGLNGSTLKLAKPGSLAQACDQSKGKCCTTPEGKKVPPGSRSGPYTCLPDGSWG